MTTLPPQLQPLAEPPLPYPFYGAGFRAANSRFWKKYATFTGRASRSEFWWAYLGVVIIVFGSEIVLGIIIGIMALVSHGFRDSGLSVAVLILSIIVVLAYFALIVPQLALTVRRLHDTNRSGWYILMGLIPYAGGIIIIVFAASRSVREGARFDDPVALIRER